MMVTDSVITDKQVYKANIIHFALSMLFIVIGTPVLQNIMDTYENNTIGSWIISFVVVVALNIFSAKIFFIKYMKATGADLIRIQELASKHKSCKMYVEYLSSINRTSLYKLDLDKCNHIARNELESEILKK